MQKKLGIPVSERRNYKTMLKLAPFTGNLLYPILPIRGSHRKAGYYERRFEARNQFGTPYEASLGWLFTTLTAPLYVTYLSTYPFDFSTRYLSEEDMQNIDVLAQLAVKASANNV